VGNLSTGGTGKSPMVEYLVRLLKDDFKVATLSRGYMRKTRGYALANETTTALEIGDEPMQFHIKFPGVPVAVGEERLDAIPQLLHDRPGLDAIILDDAFQHRSVKAGLNILLTDCNNLFTFDFYLPTGDLRDLKSSYKRAHIIVVTKCDPSLADSDKQSLTRAIRPRPGQSIFFAAMKYGHPYHIHTKQVYHLHDNTEVLLVSGIANPRPLKVYLEEKSKAYYMQQYPDHHIFTIDELREIRRKFRQLDSPEKIILTTEKDAVRLVKFDRELVDLPIYVLPVSHYFLFGEAKKFNELVTNFIKNFRQADKTNLWEEKMRNE
jgi:tetraacyldisaccharide 4'-kinase